MEAEKEFAKRTGKERKAEGDRDEEGKEIVEGNEEERDEEECGCCQ